MRRAVTALLFLQVTTVVIVVAEASFEISQADVPIECPASKQVVPCRMTLITILRDVLLRTKLWSLKKFAFIWSKCHLLQHVLTNFEGYSLILNFRNRHCCLRVYSRLQTALAQSIHGVELVSHDNHTALSCPLSQWIVCDRPKQSA